MGRYLTIFAFAFLVATVAGTAAAVTIDSHPQQVRLSEHTVTADKKFSIDVRSTVYAGNDIDGYDVTVRNDGSTQLSVDVTVQLRTLDGTLVAQTSDSATALTGSTATVTVRFDTPVTTAAFDHVVVEATVS